jgi:hypothetical protein
MTWLILIVRLGRAAPRYRRRVYAELGNSGAVPVSDGVWAIPDTVFHRAAVNTAVRGAALGGGDIVILATSPENAPSHEVLEAKLAERLNAEAAAIVHRCREYAAMARRCAPGLEPDDRVEEFFKLERDIRRLSLVDVIGLEAVASAVARVAETGSLRGTADVA